MRMHSPTPKPALLATFWFGIQALWGALLGISLQLRTTQLAPDHAVIAYGQLAAAGALTAVIVQLVMGPLSDRLRAGGTDRRWFFITGALLGCIGIFGFYLAQTFPMLIGALVFLQIGMNIAIGPYQAIIPDYMPSAQAGGASAWMAALQSLGNAAGAVCAVLLSGTPVLLAGVLAFLVVVTGAITVLHIARLVPRAIGRASGVVPYSLSRAAIDLFISRAVLWIGFYTVLGYMFFYVHDTLHIANAVQSSGIVILIFTVFGAAGAALSARPADAMDRRVVVNGSSGIFMIGLISFVLVRDERLMYAAAAIAGTGWGGFLAADWALGCSILPPGIMATAMGIWNIAVAGPQIIAPALTTIMVLSVHVDKAVAPLYALSLATLEALVGALWIWRLPAPGQKDR